jgi:hypothetical protein
MVEARRLERGPERVGVVRRDQRGEHGHEDDEQQEGEREHGGLVAEQALEGSRPRARRARADRRLVERDPRVLDQQGRRLDVARERPLTEDLVPAHDVLTRGLR